MCKKDTGQSGLGSVLVGDPMNLTVLVVGYSLYWLPPSGSNHCGYNPGSGFVSEVEPNKKLIICAQRIICSHNKYQNRLCKLKKCTEQV